MKRQWRYLYSYWKSVFTPHLCRVTSKNKTTKTEEKNSNVSNGHNTCVLSLGVCKKKKEHKVFHGLLIEFLWPFVRSAVVLLQTEMDFKCNKINVILSRKGHSTIYIFFSKVKGVVFTTNLIIIFILKTTSKPVRCNRYLS